MHRLSICKGAVIWPCCASAITTRCTVLLDETFDTVFYLDLGHNILYLYRGRSYAGAQAYGFVFHSRECMCGVELCHSTRNSS